MRAPRRQLGKYGNNGQNRCGRQPVIPSLSCRSTVVVPCYTIREELQLQYSIHNKAVLMHREPTVPCHRLIIATVLKSFYKKEYQSNSCVGEAPTTTTFTTGIRYCTAVHRRRTVTERAVLLVSCQLPLNGSRVSRCIHRVTSQASDRLIVLIQ